MRWRDFLIPTSKETPKDATALSHVLMLRAGLIRPVMAEVYIAACRSAPRRRGTLLASPTLWRLQAWTRSSCVTFSR